MKYVGGRLWQRWWSCHAKEPPDVGAQIERESERLSLVLVQGQIRTIEAEQRQAVAADDEPQVVGLAQLRGIGVGSGWVLVKELFGWRRFRNRREVAGCLGLAPSPYASGESEIEQGISKAGNWRVRTLMVELAWRWLRYQPESELSQWFMRRFAGGDEGQRIGLRDLGLLLGHVSRTAQASQPAHDVSRVPVADPALHHPPAQRIPGPLYQRLLDVPVLQHVVRHAIVDPVRTVLVPQRGIEANRVQIHDLVRVPCVAQPFSKALQDGVTKRPRVMVCVDRQDSHGTATC